MSIAERLHRLKTELGQCQLVAVSKTYPAKVIQEACDAGHRHFGENRVQELCSKQPLLPQTIAWHQIGSLQTNKVKYIAPFVSLIHSVDSLKLLAEINRQAEKHNRNIHCLLQMHIATEETKHGLNYHELDMMLQSPELSECRHITICGLMGMASNTPDRQQVAGEFASLRKLFEQLQKGHFAGQAAFAQVSMGMSSDYRIALAEGSTMVRLGSAVFVG